MRKNPEIPKDNINRFLCELNREFGELVPYEPAELYQTKFEKGEIIGV